MLPFNSTRIFATVGSAVFLFLSVLFSQSPTPTASPSPDASPSVSPSPSPARAPSPTPLPDAQNFHQWGSVTVFNGLPSDRVRAIDQTPDGVMWFGTDNGLARFDGRRIQNFLPGGAEANRIMALKLGASGDLWIGTNDGAFVYSGNRFHPVRGSESFGITAVSIGTAISLGTDAGLVLRVTGEAPDRLSAAPMFADPLRLDDGTPLNVTALVEHDGKLLASTSGRGTFIVDSAGISELASSPRPLFVNSIAAGVAGELWLGTDAPRTLSGIYLTGTSPRAVRVPALTSNVLSLSVTDSGVWAGTERFGLFHIINAKLRKNYTFENTSGGLRSNTVLTLFTDREGVLWIGTNRGVSRFDRLGAVQQTVSDIPNSNFIRTLYQAPGEQGLLYAGSNRGLFTFDRGKKTWTQVPAFRNRVVYAVRKRYESSIVVGGPDGLFDISGRKLLDGDVRGLAGFNLRDYAAVFGRGIFDVTDAVPKLVVADPTVTSIGERWNKLWVGTLDRGLFSFAGKTMSSEADADKLKSGTIWSVSNVSTDGSTIGPAYIAGQHGVFVVRNDGAVEQIIATEDVRDVVERDGHIWAASTTRGLLHARHDDRFGWLVSSIAFEQGLPSEKAFSIQPEDDSLIVATNRGVVTYEAGKVAPKLIATRVLSQRAHDLAELRSIIPLDYPQNSLLVEVAGQSSRTFPEEFKYGFILTDSKGNEVGRRISNESQYAPTDLSPGDYTIEAIAFNRDLLPSEPLFIRFSVAKAPFPWTATALGVLLLMALVALAWAIFEHRRIRQRNRELAAARLELANEAERERRRIARDLHDQTLADLRNLMIKSDKFGVDRGQFRNEIEAVSTDIRRICEDLSPSVLENVGLVAALEFLLTGSGVGNHRFSTSENADELVNFPMTVQLHIYRIAQEILANIVQHSNANLVEMNVDVSAERRFLLTIRDNGELFQPGKAAGTGRGIANIRSRANLIGAKILWTGHPDGGNVFSLRLGE